MTRITPLGMPPVTVKVVEQAEVAQIERLYREAGWWQPEYSPDFIPSMISGSCCFVVAVIDAEIVGMGRAISDGVSDAYLQDIVVMKQYRGRGIGRAIIGEIIHFLRQRKIDWIGLIGVPGSEEFYRESGFKLMPGHLPMQLEL